jgi:hypothetical protein
MEDRPLATTGKRSEELKSIKSKALPLLLATGLMWMAGQTVEADTISADTTLMVKTSTAISSRDVAGKQFQSELAQAVSVNGAVILPARTKLVGVVQLPRVQIASSTRPLTLKLKQLSLRSHVVPIKTEPLEAKNNSPWRSRNGAQINGRAFLFSPERFCNFASTSC